MKQSFYQYLMTQRNPNQHDEVTQFANNAFLTTAFLNKRVILNSSAITSSSMGITCQA